MISAKLSHSVPSCGRHGYVTTEQRLIHALTCGNVHAGQDPLVIPRKGPLLVELGELPEAELLKLLNEPQFPKVSSCGCSRKKFRETTLA